VRPGRFEGSGIASGYDCRRFDHENDGTLRGTRTVHNPLGYHEALSWSKFDGLTLQINDEVPVEDEEEFIVAIVLMPVVLALQYAKPNDGVVHLTKGLVVPPVGACLNQRWNIDHAQGRKLNIEIRCVWVRLRFTQDAFPPNVWLTVFDRRWTAQNPHGQ
jgi:hypothetical protein